MKKQRDKSPWKLRNNSVEHRSFGFRLSWGPELCGTVLHAFAVMALIGVSTLTGVAQDVPVRHSGGVTIRGTVHSSAGKLVGDAVVRLKVQGSPGAVETKTNEAGAFSFPTLATGNYVLSAEKSGLRSHAIAVNASSPQDQKQIDLVLSSSAEDLGVTPRDPGSSSPDSAQVMEFADKPNFTVAGVTDWTAVGGHGSDSSLRTSEDLTRETLTLQPDTVEHKTVGSGTNGDNESESESKLRAALASAPGSFEASHQLCEFYLHAGRYRECVPLLQTALRIDPANRGIEYDLAIALKEAGDYPAAEQHVKKLLALNDDAGLHRLAGDLDEKLGDPLAAVHEYQQAVRMIPSEENYFAWGSELLLHRAVWQAQEVFQNGTKAYPKSGRMLSGLGTALFGGARYDEAALRFC